MSSQKAAVEAYFDGFRRSDRAQILLLLADDVAWDLHGFRHLVGKDAFVAEIDNDAFVGSPILIVDRMIEEGDVVVAHGSGESTERDGGRQRFVFVDTFTFADGLITRVESYVVRERS